MPCGQELFYVFVAWIFFFTFLPDINIKQLSKLHIKFPILCKSSLLAQYWRLNRSTEKVTKSSGSLIKYVIRCFHSAIIDGKRKIITLALFYNYGALPVLFHKCNALLRSFQDLGNI